MNKTKVYLNGWEIECNVDEDGHLNLYINNDDKSQIEECDVDISRNEEEWSFRFTTENIEKEYLDNEDFNF